MGVYVKQSNITNAGRGVFAGRDFEKNEFLCYYDGYDIKYNSRELRDEEFIYCQLGSDEENVQRIGFIKPRSPFGVGQLINDGAIPEFFKTWDSGERYEDGTHLYHWYDNENGDVEKNINKYIVMSEKKRNVYFGTITGIPTWNMVASRKIKKDEELYTTYGIQYWTRIFSIKK